MNPDDRYLQNPTASPVIPSDLCDGFMNAQAASVDCRPVPADDVPEPYRSLLVHRNHMTTTLGDFYAEPVRLRVLDERLNADSYSRKIVLLRASSETVIEFGLVRIDLDSVDQAVRQEILARRRPLGDILIAHNVLRTIQPDAYFRFGPESAFLKFFDGSNISNAYGRVGTIHCNHKPAISLLEIVADRRTT